jgi:hypothetical protein
MSEALLNRLKELYPDEELVAFTWASKKDIILPVSKIEFMSFSLPIEYGQTVQLPQSIAEGLEYYGFGHIER